MRKGILLCLVLLLSGCGPTYLEQLRQSYDQQMASATTPQQQATAQKDYELKLKAYELQLLEQRNNLLRQRMLGFPEHNEFTRRW